MDTDHTIRDLAKWAVRGSDYAAPEVRQIRLSGTLLDGKIIQTSGVVRKVAPLTYQTQSGSLYQLEGPPDEAYAAYCAKNQIALDLADPIKLHGGGQ